MVIIFTKYVISKRSLKQINFKGRKKMGVIKFIRTAKGFWFESFGLLLIPKSIKLFFLVILKTVVRTYGLLFTYWWPILLLYLLLIVGKFFPALQCYTILTYEFFSFARLFCFLVCVFAIYLSCRPSVNAKKYSYYIAYKWQFLFFFALSYFWLLFMSNRFLSFTPFVFVILFWLDSGFVFPRSNAMVFAIKLSMFVLPLVLACEFLSIVLNSLFYVLYQ